MTSTVAYTLVKALKATGTQRMFGLPGGGSSLDLIHAGSELGIPFVLTRHECSAVIMAATTAELDGSVGVAITTKGPGTANAANGVAHASLDRCAVAVITDGFSEAHRAYVSHQWYDQQAFLAPLVKAHSTLTDTSEDDVRKLLDSALAPRQGPVHIELTGVGARAVVDPVQTNESPARDNARKPKGAGKEALELASQLLAKAKKPVIVAGLEARDSAVAKSLREWVDALRCPALVTYKAKGVIAENNDAYTGIFTGGAVEQAVVNEADLIILAGVDPVEFILQPWPYSQPVLELSRSQHPMHYVTANCRLLGNLQHNIEQLVNASSVSQWQRGEADHHRKNIALALKYGEVKGGLGPEQAVTVASRQAQRQSRHPRVTVDAGAHMFSATSFWPCYEPNDLLISNGLATMGFAVPAAIASALHEPDRSVIAFTGDGGLLMCLGELAVCVEHNLPVIIVVFNDGALSLIDIKQQQRELPVDGVRWPRCNFAATMESLGGTGVRVDDEQDYAKALERAFASGTPTLIDVKIDPSGYPAQLRALRG